jgi:hypothetical protein
MVYHHFGYDVPRGNKRLCGSSEFDEIWACSCGCLKELISRYTISKEFEHDLDQF